MKENNLMPMYRIQNYPAGYSLQELQNSINEYCNNYNSEVISVTGRYLKGFIVCYKVIKQG